MDPAQLDDEDLEADVERLSAYLQELRQDFERAKATPHGVAFGVRKEFLWKLRRIQPRLAALRREVFRRSAYPDSVTPPPKNLQ